MYNPYRVSFPVLMLLMVGVPVVFAALAALRVYAIDRGKDDERLPRRGGRAVVPFLLTPFIFCGIIVALMQVSRTETPVWAVAPCFAAASLLLPLSGKRGCTLWAGAAGFACIAVGWTIWAIHLEDLGKLDATIDPPLVVVLVALAWVASVWRYLRVTKKSV